MELDEDTAMLIWSMAETLSGPLDDAEYVMVLRQARAVLPKIEALLHSAGIDPLRTTIPDVPLLRPGSKS